MKPGIEVRLGVAVLNLWTIAVVAGDPVRDEVIRGAKALAEQSDYSWETQVQVPAGTRFPPGSTTGKTEKGGLIQVSTTRGQSTTEIVIAGEKAAVTDRNGEWQSLAEAERAPGFGRFTGNMVRGIKTPAEEVLSLLEGLANLRRDGDAFVGDLTEQGATELAGASSGFGRRGGRNSNVVFAKASARFWLKEGMLARYEQVLDASLDFNGSEFVVERTTTTTIRDIGRTRIEIPAGARAKLD